MFIIYIFFVMDNLSYFILGVFGVLCIFWLAIGMEKMAKLVITNYVLAVICLAMHKMIDMMLVQTWLSTSASSAKIYDLLSTGRIGIIVVTYLFLLVLILNKSKLHLDTNNIPIPKFGLGALLVFMTAISVIITLWLAVWWVKILESGQMVLIFGDMVRYSWIAILVKYIPMVAIIHWLMTVYIMVESTDWD